MMVWVGAARGVVRNTGWVLVIISQQIFITNSTATTTIRGVNSEKNDSFLRILLSLFCVFREGGVLLTVHEQGLRILRSIACDCGHIGGCKKDCLHTALWS